MGKLSSVASLTMCLAVANAFVARLPRVAPAYPAWRGQSSSRFRAPLGGDDRRVVGAGGTLSRIDGSDAAEAEKRSQSRVPSTEGHAAVGSRSTVALHVFKGLEVRDNLRFFLSLSKHGSKDSTAALVLVGNTVVLGPSKPILAIVL